MDYPDTPDNLESGSWFFSTVPSVPDDKGHSRVVYTVIHCKGYDGRKDLGKVQFDDPAFTQKFDILLLKTKKMVDQMNLRGIEDLTAMEKAADEGIFTCAECHNRAEDGDYLCVECRAEADEKP